MDDSTMKLSETAMNLHSDAVVLKSSDAMNWSNLNVCVTNAKPSDRESVHGGGQDLWISMPIDPQPLEISVITERREHQLSLRQHQVCIHPPHVVFGTVRKNDSRFLHVFLKKKLWSEVLRDLFDRDIDDLDAASKLDIHDPGMSQLLRMMQDALSAPIDYPALRMDYLGRALITDVLNRHLSLSLHKKRINFHSGLSVWQIRRVTERMHDSLGAEITLDALAEAVNLGRTSLILRFKATFGVTPYQYLIQARIRQAQRLLSQTRLPIAEVAMRCGFFDQAHFSRYFRKVTGVQPSAYRWSV
jgi:AraC family transcriptional regulator